MSKEDKEVREENRDRVGRYLVSVASVLRVNTRRKKEIHVRK